MELSTGVFQLRFLQATILSVSTLLFAAVAVAQIRTVVIPLIDPAEFDPALVQTRVSGTCDVVSFIAAIAEDGSVTCEKSGTAAVFSANGVDVTPDVAVIDQQRLWLDECLTPSYVAGPGETALVSASVGLTLSDQMQARLILLPSYI